MMRKLFCLMRTWRGINLEVSIPSISVIHFNAADTPYVTNLATEGFRPFGSRMIKTHRMLIYSLLSCGSMLDFANILCVAQAMGID